MKGEKQKLKNKELREILFAKALEEGFGSEALYSDSLAEYSIQNKEEKSAEKFLAGRSVLINKNAENRYGFGYNTYAASIRKTNSLLLITLCVVSLTIGIFSNYLNTSGDVNLILNPLTALFLWNIIVFFLQVFFLFRKAKTAATNGWKYHLIKRTGDMVTAGIGKLIPGNGKATRKKTIVESIKKYNDHLWKISRTTEIAKLKLFFNCASVFLVSGVIAGLYLKGSLVNYQFFLESTFFSGGQILEDLAGAFLYPASAIFKFSLPAMDTFGGKMPGANWIHLLALSAVVYVFIPRLILIILSLLTVSGWRNSIRLDLGEGYFLSILKQNRGTRIEGDLYFYNNGQDSSDGQFVSFLSSVVCGPFKKALSRNVDWGEQGVSFAGQSLHKILVFNGLQTPEEEVHGQFLKSAIQFDYAEKTNIHMVVTMTGLSGQSLEPRQEIWSDMALRFGIDKVNFYSGDEQDER